MPARITATDQLGRALTLTSRSTYATVNTGSPSSKYEYRRTSAMLRKIPNITICMRKNLSFSWPTKRISIKNSLTCIKCVLRLSCEVHGTDLWPFYRLYCKRFSLDVKVYQGWGLQRSGPTDPPKENGRKFAPSAPVSSKLRLGNTR